MDPSALPPFPWVPAMVARLEARMAGEGRDGAHDLSHALRVARGVHALALEEGADAEVAVAAALLHDVVHLPKNHPEAPLAGVRGAEEARAWCLAEPALADRADRVAEAVATHSFSAGRRPASLEGAVLQDADRLEAIGAIGLARCFATGGAMGAGLWHPTDPWATGRETDDKAWSLDHFPRKLLRLADGMNTEAGRRRARARHALLETFLAALREELGP